MKKYLAFVYVWSLLHHMIDTRKARNRVGWLEKCSYSKPETNLATSQQYDWHYRKNVSELGLDGYGGKLGDLEKNKGS